MKIELHDVAKGSARARALDPVSICFASGTATLVEAETEQRPTVLGLIASGRMRPDAGTVLIDGAPNSRAIRTRTALVDAPEVCDPAPNVAVTGLVEEELMFAGRPANLLSARRWLDQNGFAHLGRLPIADVAPRERIALLLELTALRKRVEAMVLVSPDRHGGDPREWWDVVQGFAARGYAMLVVAGRASAVVLQGMDAADDHGRTDEQESADADAAIAATPADDDADDADDAVAARADADDVMPDTDGAASAAGPSVDETGDADEIAAAAASTPAMPEPEAPDASADGSEDAAGTSSTATETDPDAEGGR